MGKKLTDIGNLRPDTLPQVITEAVKVVDRVLLRPATLTQVIVEVVDIGQVWPANINLLLNEDMLIELDIGHKIPDNMNLEI